MEYFCRFHIFFRSYFEIFFKRNSEIRVGFMNTEIIFCYSHTFIVLWNIFVMFRLRLSQNSHFFNGIFRFGSDCMSIKIIFSCSNQVMVHWKILAGFCVWLRVKSNYFFLDGIKLWFFAIFLSVILFAWGRFWVFFKWKYQVPVGLCIDWNYFLVLGLENGIL